MYFQTKIRQFASVVIIFRMLIKNDTHNKIQEKRCIVKFL